MTEAGPPRNPAPLGRGQWALLAVVVGVLSVIWLIGVGVVVTHLADRIQLGLTSCLPTDFPHYPGSTLGTLVVSDPQGNCVMTYQTRDSAASVQQFFENRLMQGDWIVTSVDSATGTVYFRRVSDPGYRGYVRAMTILQQTQFQVVVRRGS